MTLKMADTQRKLGTQHGIGHCAKMFPDNISYNFRNITPFNSAKQVILPFPFKIREVNFYT